MTVNVEITGYEIIKNLNAEPLLAVADIVVDGIPVKWHIHAEFMGDDSPDSNGRYLAFMGGVEATGNLTEEEKERLFGVQFLDFEMKVESALEREFGEICGELESEIDSWLKR